jgi:dienelactone hydrolase
LEKLPGVLVAHQWLGLSKGEKQVADELAERGYVAFASDVYGKVSLPLVIIPVS